MNKRDPKAVYKVFEQQLSENADFYRLARQGLVLQKQEAAYSGYLAEQGFHTLYVQFETFVSDLFITLINRDPAPYQMALYRSIEDSTKSRFGQFHVSLIEAKPYKHLSIERIENLVDAKGQNLTFSSVERMIDLAKQWLSQSHAERFAALDADERAFIELSRLIRNAIAHRSTLAFRELREHLSKLPADGSICANFRRERSVAEMGAYLRSKVEGDVDRVQFSSDVFLRLGRKLACD
jgi:hypothetical protein